MTRRLVLVLAFASFLAACGGNDVTLPPAPVPDDLVPSMLGEFLVLENRDESTLAAFANPGERTLVSDTRLFEIRRGDRLVGTLQLSTVLPGVDLADDSVRERFVGQVILGQFSRIRIGDVEAFTTTTNDKTVALWFGQELFEVLQTKDRELDPEQLLTAIISHQATAAGWRPLPQLLDFEDG